MYICLDVRRKNLTMKDTAYHPRDSSFSLDGVRRGEGLDLRDRDRSGGTGMEEDKIERQFGSNDTGTGQADNYCLESGR